MAAPPSRADILKAIASILKPDVDLNAWKLSTLVDALTKQFDQDMKPQKALIKELVQEHLTAAPQVGESSNKKNNTHAKDGDGDGDDNDNDNNDDDDDDDDDHGDDDDNDGSADVVTDMRKVPGKANQLPSSKKPTKAATKATTKTTAKSSASSKRTHEEEATVAETGYLRRGAAIKADKKSKTQAAQAGVKPATGFTKPCQLSPELAAVVGADQMTRGQVNKAITQYIKDNELQKNPKNKNIITCDDKLKSLFGVDQFEGFFTIGKLVAPHISKAASTEKDTKKTKGTKRANGDDDDDGGNDGEDGSDSQPAKKKRKSTFPDLALSEKLAAFLGQERMSRGQITKNLIQYVKDNNLQNPKNKKQILCDQAMQDVFGVKTTDFFKIQKLISQHAYRS